MKSTSIFFLILSTICLSLNIYAQSGSIDYSFNIGNGATSPMGADISCILIQPDGKIIIGGNFNQFNGTNRTGLLRLNNNGSVDSLFNYGSGFASGIGTSVKAIASLSNGDLLVAQNIYSYNGKSNNGLIKIKSNGQEDTTFGFQFGFAECLSVLPNSKVLVGGVGLGINGTNVIKIDDNGLQDTSFNCFTGNNIGSTAFTMLVQPDGKIIFAIEVSGIYSIIRMNADGTKDINYYSSNLGIDALVWTIGLQQDGKVLIGGAFNNFYGQAKNGIVRLNSDGTIDNTFNIGSGFNGPVHSIKVQPDGKILVGGAFGTYDSQSASNIIRLNQDGTIDPTFVSLLGFDNGLRILQLEPNNKIIAGGVFSSYNGFNSNRIIRLNNIIPNQVSESYKSTTLLFPNPIFSNHTLSLQNKVADEVEITLWDVKGNKIQQSYKGKADSQNMKINNDIHYLSKGRYFYKIQINQILEFINFSKL